MTALSNYQEKFCVAHYEYMSEDECKSLEIPNGSIRLTPQLTGYRTHSEASEIIQNSGVENAIVILECDVFNTDRPFYALSEIIDLNNSAQLSCVVQAFKKGEI